MNVSRRRFIRSAAVCALATGALLRNPLAAFGQAAGGGAAMDFPIPYEATTSPVFHYTKATFEPYLNSIFTAAGARSRTVELELFEIRSYSPSPVLVTARLHRQTECFSLLFRSAAPLSELTTIHKLEHAALGKFELFLTESAGRGGYVYEAVINHVTS